MVNEYDNTYHRTIKMKPVDVKGNTYMYYSKKLMIKILILKLVIMYEFPNAIFLLKDTLQTGPKKFLWLKKVKNTVSWTYVISDLKGEEITGTFYEKELQKTNQQTFRIEKVIKKKGDKLYVKWKGYNSSFNSWIDKKDLIK